jgi:hypothetical protein
MIPVQTLGWMAGVLDLKGRVTRKGAKYRKHPQITLYVETREMFIIRELGRMTGTKPELQNPQEMPEWMRKGCTEHCPDAHVHVERVNFPPVARWTISGAGAAVVLYNLLPYMVSDKGLEEVLVETLATIPPSGQGRSAVDQAVNRLEALGWEIPAGVRPVPDKPATASTGDTGRDQP